MLSKNRTLRQNLNEMIDHSWPAPDEQSWWQRIVGWIISSLAVSMFLVTLVSVFFKAGAGAGTTNSILSLVAITAILFFFSLHTFFFPRLKRTKKNC